MNLPDFFMFYVSLRVSMSLGFAARISSSSSIGRPRGLGRQHGPIQLVLRLQCSCTLDRAPLLQERSAHPDPNWLEAYRGAF
jgi:hypothetical protein